MAKPKQLPPDTFRLSPELIKPLADFMAKENRTKSNAINTLLKKALKVK